jgi:hypothetical protein
MLRVFGTFLTLFWLLALIVHLDSCASWFGGAALALFAIDLLMAQAVRTPPSRVRRWPVL